MLAPPPLPRTLEASLRDLDSKKPAVRASAIKDLVRHARLADEVRANALPRIEVALAKDDSAEVRSAAALALADLRASEALPTLLVAVEDAHPHVRQMALTALGEIGDRRALQRLARALDDERPEVRYQAVIAYARLSEDEPRDVAGVLVRALDDDDPNIVYIALRVAEEHATGADTDALAARAETLLASKTPPVGVAAAIYLARRSLHVVEGSPADTTQRTLTAEATEVLLRVARGDLRGIATEDEEAALELAGELPLKEAEPHLERRAWGLGRVLRGGGDAWHAKIALARMGHERARGEILRDLASWRRVAREAAVVAAGRARLTEAREAIVALGEGRADPQLVAEALARLR